MMDAAERRILSMRLDKELTEYGKSWERWADFEAPSCGGSPMEAMEEDIGHHEFVLLEAIQKIIDEVRSTGPDFVIEPEDVMHESHDIRGSDASSFDFICKTCGHVDLVTGGWGKLKYPCGYHFGGA